MTTKGLEGLDTDGSEGGNGEGEGQRKVGVWTAAFNGNAVFELTQKLEWHERVKDEYKSWSEQRDRREAEKKAREALKVEAARRGKSADGGGGGGGDGGGGVGKAGGGAGKKKKKMKAAANGHALAGNQKKRIKRA